MKQLVFLAIIFVVYLLLEWWKARNNRLEEDEPPPWPGQPPRPPAGASPPRPVARPTVQPSRAASWEEELRRILQGEMPVQPPPPPVAPPPLPRPAVPATVTVSRHPPPLVLRPVPAEDPDMQRGLPVQLPGLEQSGQAYQRASRLEDRVAQQLRRVQEQVTTHKKAEIRTEAALEVRQALGLLRGRSAQRAAILASVILGPPRALAPDHEP